MRTRNILIGILVAVLVIGAASAALVPYYAKLRGTSDLVQSVVVWGNDSTTIADYTIGSVAGNTYVNGPFPIENRADIPAYVSFETRADYGGGVGNANIPDVTVTTTYFGKLILENKNPTDWTIISGDGISATLTYTLQGNEFGYDLDGTVPLKETEYALIYYADRQDRFVDWGGDNPGALIGTATSDANGNISMTGSPDLGMDLPATEDWNAGPSAEAEYSGYPDNYRMSSGAKLWLVPSSAYDKSAKKVTTWSQVGDFLFETDLIAYHDEDQGCGLRLGANSEIDMYIENAFVIDAMPGAYRIITLVNPETSCPLTP